MLMPFRSTMAPRGINSEGASHFTLRFLFQGFVVGCRETPLVSSPPCRQASVELGSSRRVGEHLRRHGRLACAWLRWVWLVAYFEDFVSESPFGSAAPSAITLVRSRKMRTLAKVGRVWRCRCCEWHFRAVRGHAGEPKWHPGLPMRIAADVPAAVAALMARGLHARACTCVGARPS